MSALNETFHKLDIFISAKMVFSDVFVLMGLCPLVQIEEVEALSSIYGDEWCVIDEASRIFCIRISDDLEEPKVTVCLQVDGETMTYI